MRVLNRTITTLSSLSVTLQCRFSSLPGGLFLNPLTTTYPDRRIVQRPLILWRAFRRSVPAPLGDFLCRFPTKAEKRFKEFSTASKKVAKSVFDTASQQTNGEEDLKGSKDVLSVLLRSNMTADPKKALDEDEVLSQMAYVPRQVLIRS